MKISTYTSVQLRSIFIPFFVACLLVSCSSGDDSSGSTSGDSSGSSSGADSCFYNTRRSDCEDTTIDYYVTSFLSGSGNQCPVNINGLDAQATGDVGTCIFDGSQTLPPGGLENFEGSNNGNTSSGIANPANIACGANEPNYLYELHPTDPYTDTGVARWRPSADGKLYISLFADDTDRPQDVFTGVSSISMSDLAEVIKLGWTYFPNGELSEFLEITVVDTAEEANVTMEWSSDLFNADFDTNLLAQAGGVARSGSGHTSRGRIRFNRTEILNLLYDYDPSDMDFQARLDNKLRTVANHEFGHILGISPHPSNVASDSTVMESILTSVGFVTDYPSTYDVNTVREIYCPEFQ